MSRASKNKTGAVPEKTHWKDLKYFVYKRNCFITTNINRARVPGSSQEPYAHMVVTSASKTLSHIPLKRIEDYKSL